MSAPTERQILQYQETIRSEKDKSQGLIEINKQLEAELSALKVDNKMLREDNETLKNIFITAFDAFGVAVGTKKLENIR